ncbi:MAG: hypothetical protein ACLSHO_09525 [Dysosmobacter sp.]
MTMLCDFYELTMGNGYLQAGLAGPDHAISTCFSAMFRTRAALPSAPGLEQVIDYIREPAL